MSSMLSGNRILSQLTCTYKDLYFDLFLLSCTSVVLRTRGNVDVVYLLFCLANYREPSNCKQCRSSLRSR